jgi:two-component system response regulator FixJ
MTGPGAIASTAKGIRPRTVFVIDDNPTGRESLRWLLESAHLPVETYESGIAFLRQPPTGREGCVVLDLQMRGMRGPDVEARLAKVMKMRLPVIMISGAGEESPLNRALRAKAYAVVERPFTGRALLQVVQRAMGAEAGSPPLPRA